jgi:putative endonuclease
MIENKLGHYYTGICTDVERRFAEHQCNGAKCAKALRGKGPLSLLFYTVMDSHSDALRQEISIKKLSKADKVKLVNNQLAAAALPNMHKERE